MKKQSDLSRLMGYAGKHKILTYTSWVLSAVSALVSLVPFVYIWMIIRDVLAVAPNYSEATNIVHYGVMAVVFAIAAFLIYIGALMCSHLSAFRVATNLRLAVTEHIAKLLLGFVDSFGSGKLRKIISDSTGATETFLAHQLPDKAGAIATPLGLIVMLFVFDWRLGILSLVPVVLGFVIMSPMTGKRIFKDYKQEKDVHISGLLADFMNQTPVTAGDFADLAGKILLILPDQDFFSEKMQADLVKLMHDPQIAYVSGGHLSTLLKADEYIRTIREFLGKK